MSYAPQKYAFSCGLACIGYILGKSEDDLIDENPDILSVSQMNFLGLYCPDIVQILARYGEIYEWSQFSNKESEYIEQTGTIVYITQIDHYLVRLDTGWGDSHIFRTGLPEFGYRQELPYPPSYVIYRPQYH